MRCWSDCKEIPHAQVQRRNPSKMVREENSHLESNPIPTRDAQRAQTNLGPGPRDPTETETVLYLSISCGGMGLKWSAAGALGATDLGMAQALLEEVAINPTIELPELKQDWEIDFGGHKQNLMCTRTQEKGAMTPQKTNPDLPRNVQESPVEALGR